MVTTIRYNIRSVRNMLAQLEAWIEQTEESLANEEDKDYPSENRLDNLQTRLDAFTSAIEALQEIE